MKLAIKNPTRFKLSIATLAATITALVAIPAIADFRGYTGAGAIWATVLVLAVFLIVVDVGRAK